MTNTRFRIAALLICGLWLIIAAPAAQATWSCGWFNEIGLNWLAGEELQWYNRNCRSAPDTDDDDEDESDEAVVLNRPTAVTCPRLPSRVAVFGYVYGTQCQMVSNVVISMNPELEARGFIDAVDVWSYVNGGIEVCFRAGGWLAFLDAAYAPRMASELASFMRDGMTCGTIDRAGTVVLLAQGTLAETSPALPTFDALPQTNCQIKLVETLFLRAEPAGQIIGLVWLNSEVPVFEIDGDWYKVEFEGTTGYISRFYSRVLYGGCI